MKNLLINIVKQMLNEKLKGALQGISIELLKQVLNYIENELKNRNKSSEDISFATAAKFNLPYYLVLELVAILKRKLNF